MRASVCPACVCSALLILALDSADAQVLHRGDDVRVARAAGSVRVDGVLDDDVWASAERIEAWYEFSPGDNVEPPVASIARLAFDDRFFYAAFEFHDPEPSSIRAPLTDRDRIFGNGTDYGGLIVDTRGDGHSAIILMATASGVQYDAVTDDATNEDSAPDFFWDSAARITEQGWTLEIRVPFSSLRYRDVEPQAWGILLYRNYPRDFRHQLASTRIPRGSNCTVCNISPLIGLRNLPTSQHLVAAPYLSTTSVARPAGALGSPLGSGRTTSAGGLDVKWMPNADTAFDFAVNPDFSQVEADTAQITANELFALSFAEKRPFFLEGVELLSTPIRAVYTRSITDPRWGARATGKAAGFSYTTLVADDAGGGSLLIPGATGSTTVAQDFKSYVLVARAKRDIGSSFVSLLVTDREGHGGSRYNRVFGPDFQWRDGPRMLTGQLLVSDTKEADGPGVVSHLADIEWRHDSTHLELNTRYRDAGDGFRADVGFVPQVAYRELSGRAGWTARPSGAVRRLRVYSNFSRQHDRTGRLVAQNVQPTLGMDVRWNGYLQFRLNEQRTSNDGILFDRRQFAFFGRINPSQRFQEFSVDLTAGRDADFANVRPARGVTFIVNATVNVTRRFSLQLVQNTRQLYVDAAEAERRLLVARVSRVRGSYMFTANSFLRVIAQYTSTGREPSLFRASVPRRSGVLSGSLLFAYKLNWQSVMFVGYGDDRELTPEHDLALSSRQFFAKVSYAFQR